MIEQKAASPVTDDAIESIKGIATAAAKPADPLLMDAAQSTVEVAELVDEDEDEDENEIKASAVEQAGASKHDLFVRQMAKRKRLTIRHLLNIANLTSNSYEFTQEEINRHFSDIDKALDIVKTMFNTVLEEKQIYDQFDV